MAEIGRIGDDGRERHAWVLGGPARMQMGERGGEAGPSVDLGKEIGDPDRGQAGVERRERRLGFVRRDGLQRCDPHPAVGEQDVLQRVEVSLAADVRKTSVQERAPRSASQAAADRGAGIGSGLAACIVANSARGMSWSSTDR